MELGEKLSSCRKKAGLSQEDLAEKIYVSRQTISNWENNRSYPDIHSLIALVNLFNLSLDQLVEGDIDEMKEIVQRDDLKKFNRDGWAMTIGLLIMALTAYPLIYFLGKGGFVIFIFEWLVVMYFALRIEKFKKENRVQTYKEILAISKGQTLNRVETIEEKAKYPYQNPLLVLGVTVVFCLIIGLSALLINNLF
ncbi:helix-turn-helix domain-containing protein [Streptococcus pseudoporcinus]|uniref:Transcriptional regulator n=1 Tax=Streptococcus pseudoporcinus TaxID=361101 RepID=A0A4U9YJP7_9STRE|nr:helix-turn-helix transcriptional regulator [Streptococcus pseudoporcinus]VTS26586.1 transcriptional regulator [Streptococcus pseudoporcinus]VUC71789.1 transcriptional regulator [Streptococcus pseudoporcinus]VUD01000.1 transcriptional regulator [Streptococcus pseudoporcinus]VUD01269.1 transcriptional regulator [Streptococcus pseudoporcinus]